MIDLNCLNPITDFHLTRLEQVDDFIIIFDQDRTEFSYFQFQINF